MKIKTLIIARRKIGKIGTYGQNEDKDSCNCNCKKKDKHIWKDTPSKIKMSLFMKSLNYLPLFSIRKRNKLN